MLKPRITLTLCEQSVCWISEVCKNLLSYSQTLQPQFDIGIVYKFFFRKCCHAICVVSSKCSHSMSPKFTSHNVRESCRRCSHLRVVCYDRFVNALEVHCVHVRVAIPKHANENCFDVSGCEGSVRRWPENTGIIIIIIIIKVCVATVMESKQNLLYCIRISFHFHEITIAEMTTGPHHSLFLPSFFPPLCLLHPYSLYSTEQSSIYIILYYPISVS
jgi:hypothetical protein